MAIFEKDFLKATARYSQPSVNTVAAQKRQGGIDFGLRTMLNADRRDQSLIEIPTFVIENIAAAMLCGDQNYGKPKRNNGMSTFKFIKCSIERGGFSSERTFAIEDSNGREIIGIADIEHLCDETMNPLSDDEPPIGTKMTGFVKCRVIREIGSGEILIDLPNSEVVYVRADVLVNSHR